MTTSGADATAEQALLSARRALLSRIEDLGRDVAGIVAATVDANADDEHDPEGSTIAWEREQTGALLADARARLAAVDAALGRVHAGTYGTCAACGRPIAPERLAARPAADTCVGCAGRSRP